MSTFENLRRLGFQGSSWTEPRNHHIEPRRRSVAAGKKNMVRAVNNLVNYTLALSDRNFKNEKIRKKVREYFIKKHFSGGYPTHIVNAYGKRFQTSVPFPRIRQNY